MKEKKIIKCFMGMLLFMIFGCQQSKENKKPNLLYVFPDQFRKHSLAFWNSPQFKGAIRTKGDPVYTPELDKFAEDALVLTNMVSNCPLCSPHRGSLMTGLYPGSSGVPLNCNANRPISSLRTDVICFSDILGNCGYELAYIGKWHLDYPLPNDPSNPGHYVDLKCPAWDAYTPKERRHGFNYWYSYGTWNAHKNPHYYDNEGKRYEPGLYSPKHEADKAIAYLKNNGGERNSDKPFALFVAMNPPHGPYNSLNDCLKKDYDLYKDVPINVLLHRENVNSDMKKAKSAPYYFANVTGVDREFGRIIKQLKDMGEFENTVIVFTSDHGETMCSQGINDPKNNIYTEAFDVPFLIRWPAFKKTGIDNILMNTPDIMPTLLGIMGLQKVIPSSIQGFNYSKALKGEKIYKRPKSALYTKNVDGNIDENGKVISYFPKARGIKTHRYSLELTIDNDYRLVSTKFFDDNKDPYQKNNLSVDKNNPIVIELLKEMAFWLKYSRDVWYENKILSDWINY